MSLRFIVGRAGSGKTRLCYEEIRSRLGDGRENDLILLVPEQATFQNERALALNTLPGGLLRAQVLSFRRLAWRVLNEVGGAARVYLGDLGRRMLLQGIIDRRKKDFRVFGRAAEQPGFSGAMASFLSELKLCRVSPGRLSGVAGDMDGRLRAGLSGKIRDIGLIYSDFEDQLRGRYIDPDDYINLLAERIHLSPAVSRAEVWVDGFSGFTPQEYAVLEKMMAAAERVSVTVCADGDVLEKMPGEGEVFYTTGETVRRLKELALKNGIRVERPVVLQGCRRFEGAPALSYLERHFFDNSAPPYTGEQAEISLVAAAGPRAEVEAAAREIIRLCRDEGYRWRDIAVLVRDISRYHVLVGAVFRDYGIPFFIDHKGSVTHHPLVELIRSALEAAGGGWPYEAVFRYLKTDLAPVARKDVDILENYVLAHGIRGAAWLDEKDWEFRRGSPDREETPGGDGIFLARINRARREGIKELIRFYGRVRPDRRPTFRSMSESLFNLLVDLDVPSKLVEWSDRARREGDLVRAVEHDRIWGQVVELLDQVVAAFGDEPASPEKFARILESGLVNLRMGLVPPGLDQVTVGSLDRSRSPEVKAALVLGVNDGVFPARQAEDGILTDAEREILIRHGLDLAPGTRQKVFNEQFLVYTALTRASRRLWISYCTADGEGRPMLPSRIVGRIKELLPRVRECPAAADPPGTGEEDLEFVVEKDITLGYLACRMREFLSGKENTDLWWDVYNWYAGGRSSREDLGMVLAGLFYKNAERGLSPAVAGALYGPRLSVGVSGIEEFSSCPFAHFLSRGMKLRERLHYRVTPPDMGEFLHSALRMLADRLRRDSLDWGGLDRETVSRLAGEIVEAAAPRLQNEILLSSARYRHLLTRLRRRLERSALVLAEQARRGRFRPVAVEVKFGPGGTLPPVSVNLPGGRELEITGRIDRVDACRLDRENRIVVIDYKSGFKDIDLAGIYYGINIQLPAYLDVAVENSALLTGREGRPGGIFYFTVADPLIRSSGPLAAGEVEKRIRKKLRMRGFILADHELIKLMDAEMDGSSGILPVSLTARGEFRKNSPVLSGDQFRLLGRHLRNLYRRVGRQIFSGRAAIEPIKIKNRTACRFCAFKPVCRFDPALPGNRYRIAAVLDDAQIWQKVQNFQEGGTDG
ncbi:MAG: helicase-exonuclease AddAB subunit AddB [Peptococcaceae bacterium]|nr:helicase-exonuclease AddAB subunit AddB [Peptococcaceae bacterium]